MNAIYTNIITTGYCLFFDMTPQNRPGCGYSNKCSHTKIKNHVLAHVHAGRHTHIKVSFCPSQEQEQLCRCGSWESLFQPDWKENYKLLRLSALGLHPYSQGKKKNKKKNFSLVNSSMFWAHWLLHKGSFCWTHTYKAHTKKEVNACRKLNWNILQSWCHDSPLFLYTKRRSWRTEEAGDEGMRGERRTLPPIGRRKLEETDIRQSVLKTGRHPPSLSLCLTHSSLLTPPPPSLSPRLPSSSCIPPPWENRDNKLAFFSRQDLGRRTLGQPSECLPWVPMDPSCPFPFQPARKQSLCQHLSLRKLVKVMALLAVPMATKRKERGQLGGREEKKRSG